MQRTSVERVTIVHEIFCDRCGSRARRAAEGSDFRRMTSIGFRAEEGSIFGQGQRVEIDLCEPCLRDVLGHWLRVRTLTGGVRSRPCGRPLCRRPGTARWGVPSPGSA